MKRLAGTYLIPLICCLLLGISGCGKGNIFSWAHAPGSDKTPAALSSDALTALQNKEYDKAIEYFQKILESDPGNSEAIYGAAAAELANAGLDIGSLVANLVRDQNAPGLRLAPALAFAAHAPIPYDPDNNILPEVIRNRLNTLRPAVNKVLSSGYLRKIIRGEADGKIAPDNPDVNLNIAFCLVVRAAIKAMDNGAQINSDYTVSENGSVSEVVKISIAKDIISAVHRIEEVMDKLHFGNDSTMDDIKSDVQKIIDSSGYGSTLNVNTDYYYDEPQESI